MVVWYDKTITEEGRRICVLVLREKILFRIALSIVADIEVVDIQLVRCLLAFPFTPYMVDSCLEE